MVYNISQFLCSAFTFCHLLEDPGIDLGPKPAFWMTQLPIQLLGSQAVRQTPHLHSVWRLRRHGAILPLPL